MVATESLLQDESGSRLACALQVFAILLEEPAGFGEHQQLVDLAASRSTWPPRGFRREDRRTRAWRRTDTERSPARESPGSVRVVEGHGRSRPPVDLEVKQVGPPVMAGYVQ
jgi:hypothetical protein